MFIAVVEDHHDALPWLHAALRRKALPLQDVHLVHIDAHPDLGCLRDASVIAAPRELYAFLNESDYGICEFIWPLVLKGHIHRITWLKPAFADQIAIGDYDITVGVDSTGALKVDSTLDYFVEDGASSDEALVGAKRCQLDVLVDQRAAFSSIDKVWVLDICLDYFACCDPFAGVPLTESRLTGPLPAGGCADLEECARSVDTFENELRRTAAHPPALVTVARSALDGYCPPALADELERRVVAAVGRVYGDPRVCRDVDGILALDAGEAARAFPRRAHAG
jgi:hypothetical protein